MSSSGLKSKSGYEERPKGSSLPCLCIDKPDAERFFVYESSAILEYLEELFSSREGYVDLRGKTIEQRIRTRDIISLLGDVILFHGQHIINTEPSSLSWSGLKREEWSSVSAARAVGRKHQLLSKLEDLVFTDIIREETPSISGKGAEATLADFSLMAMIQYHEDYYEGKDVIAEHGILRLWCERAMQQTWFINFARLKKLEDEGFEGLDGFVASKDGGNWTN